MAGSIEQSGPEGFERQYEAVYLVAEAVRELGDEVGVPKGLSSLGVTDADIPRLAQLTLGDACLTTNPRGASSEDIESLFRAAM